MSSDKLKELEKKIFGGIAPGELHIADHGEGPCATMFLMDAEYDPIRVTFSGDGDVVIHSHGYEYVALTKRQLEFLASKARLGAAMTVAYYDEEGEPIEQNGAET